MATAATSCCLQEGVQGLWIGGVVWPCAVCADACCGAWMGEGMMVLSPYLLCIVREELIAQLEDAWLRENCPTASRLNLQDLLATLGGMAGEW